MSDLPFLPTCVLLPLAAAAALGSPAAGDVVIDFTIRGGLFVTPGEQINASFVTDTASDRATASATVTPEDTLIAPFTIDAIAHGEGGTLVNNNGTPDDPSDDILTDVPQFRIGGANFGVNSFLPNSQDNANLLNETAPGSVQEALEFSFPAQALSITKIGLVSFDSRTDTDTGDIFHDTLKVVAGGVTYTYDASQVSLLTTETVAGDNNITVLDIEDISLAAGESITIFVATDGDGDFEGPERSDVGLHSLHAVIPEPGSVALFTCGLGLLFARRR